MPDRDKWIHGKGQSKSTGLYRDLAASSRGAQSQSTEPSDWPWSKEAKKKYGKNIAFNKAESLTERTLYHGTVKDHEKSILDIGLVPSVGDFVNHMYGSYSTQGGGAVFAADRKDLAQSVSAMRFHIAQKLGGQGRGVYLGDIGIPEIEKYGMLVVMKEVELGDLYDDPDEWRRHPGDDKLNYDVPEMPASVEPGDYFLTNERGVGVDYILTGKKLIRFLRRNGGLKNIKADQQRELIKLLVKKDPKNRSSIVKDVKRMSPLALGQMLRKERTKMESVDLLLDRIQDLLERANRTKPILMYHGTASKNLRTILKKGLVPNPKERVWQDDPSAAQSYVTVTRKTVGGTYFSTNISTATSAALTAAQQTKSEQLVVVAQIQPRSGYADEDDIVSAARRAMKRAMFPPDHTGYEDLWPAKWIEYISSPGEAKKDIAKFTKAFKNALESDLPGIGKIPLAPKAVEDMFWGLLEQVTVKWYALNKSMPYEADRYYYDAVKRLNLSREQEHKYYALMLSRLKRLSLQKAEKRYLDGADKLTRHLKKLAVPKPGDFRTNVRITEPVTFRGTNKILAVFEMRSEKGEDGHSEEHVMVHYGKVPEEAKQAFKQAQGSWTEVDSFQGASWWAKSKSESLIDAALAQEGDNEKDRWSNVIDHFVVSSSNCTSRDDLRWRQVEGDSMPTETTALDLIEKVIQGESPSELIEKVSYAYDIRLDQNIETGPVRKDATGNFCAVDAYNRVTENNGNDVCEAKPKKRKVGGKMEYALHAAEQHGITAGGSFASFSLFDKMREAGLIQSTGAGAWPITDKGKKALKDGFYYV